MSKNEIDLRKKYFQYRTMDEVSKNSVLIDYVFKVTVVKLLEGILKQLQIIGTRCVMKEMKERKEKRDKDA